MACGAPPVTCTSMGVVEEAPHLKREASTFESGRNRGGALSPITQSFARPADTSTHQDWRRCAAVERAGAIKVATPIRRACC